MQLRDIISPDGVLLDVQMKSVSHALEHVASLAAELTGVRAATICEALLARHAQGTLISKGVAVPHARIAGLPRVVSYFLRLREPMLDDSGEPVSMLFILLAPSSADGQHLRALGEVARLMRDDDFSTHLKHATTRQDIWNLLTQ